MSDVNQQVIAEFRAHHGKVGGSFEGAPLLLLHSTVAVRAEELPRTERDEKYAEQAALHPGFAGYERRTERVIPVLALVPR